MVLSDAGAEGLRIPIRVAPAVCSLLHPLNVLSGENGSKLSVEGFAVQFVGFVIPVGVLWTVQEPEHVGVLTDAVLAVIGDTGLLGVTLFGGHQDNGAGVQTIHRSGGCVLEHRDALDFVGFDFVEVARDAVHYADSALSADEQRGGIGAWLAALLESDHTRNAGADRGRHTHRRGLEDFGALHGADRIGQGGFLLGSVTDHHNFVEDGRVVFQRHVYDLTAFDGDRLGLHSEECEFERAVRGGVDSVQAVEISDHAVLRAGHENRRPGDRISLRVGHFALHDVLRESREDGKRQQQCNEEQALVFH